MPTLHVCSLSRLNETIAAVGPTIVYAFMEAVGMVNDHLVGCYRHAECAAMAENL